MEHDLANKSLKRIGIDNFQHNLELAKKCCRLAEGCDIGLLCFPECFLYLGPNATEESEEIENSKKLQCYRELAIEKNLWFSLGGFQEKHPKKKNKVYNTHIIMNNKGEVVGKYRKIHLFKVSIDGGSNLDESIKTDPGDEIVIVETPFGNLGLTVCYDIRFPELFSKLRMAGADIILVPSAFTPETGKSHWEILCRARAIESQCYIIASAQVGKHNENRTSYGHSLIVDPWGKVISDSHENSPHVSYVDINFEQIEKVRNTIPTKEHQRIDIYEKKVTVVNVKEIDNKMAKRKFSSKSEDKSGKLRVDSPVTKKAKKSRKSVTEENAMNIERDNLNVDANDQIGQIENVFEVSDHGSEDENKQTNNSRSKLIKIPTTNNNEAQNFKVTPRRSTRHKVEIIESEEYHNNINEKNAKVEEEEVENNVVTRSKRKAKESKSQSDIILIGDSESESEDNNEKSKGKSPKSKSPHSKTKSLPPRSPNSKSPNSQSPSKLKTTPKKSNKKNNSSISGSESTNILKDENKNDLKQIFYGHVKNPVDYNKYKNRPDILVGQLVIVYWSVNEACFIGRVKKSLDNHHYVVHYFIDNKNVTHDLSSDTWCFVFDDPPVQ